MESMNAFPKPNEWPMYESRLEKRSTPTSIRAASNAVANPTFRTDISVYFVRTFIFATLPYLLRSFSRRTTPMKNTSASGNQMKIAGCRDVIMALVCM